MSRIGHIGEIRVIEFLQKRLGMEVYLPIKDKGIDFVAVKGGRFFQIQVKTSMFHKSSFFWFDLYKHKMRYAENTFYILVCATMSRRQFMGRTENFIVIPSLKLREWIQEGKIVHKHGDEDCLNIFPYPDFDNKRWVYRKKRREIDDWTGYWNDFTAFVGQAPKQEQALTR